MVDRAIPAALELRMIAAEDASAANPCGDSISTRPLPRVRMTRHPPRYVPRPMASAQLAMIQNGSPVSLTLPVRWPVVMSARAMTPMVFCASLVPWDSATRDAVAI
ncbi:Uncharacterised protein [Mycobacteroides abscessus subsp. massiliense]|nr:Uncharacterised protein [Mycobacteroides abscessus subsp. massiliense]